MRLKVSQLVPGIILSEEVINNDGKILVDRNTKLNTKIINRLNQWNIFEVRVEDDSVPEDVKKNRHNLFDSDMMDALDLDTDTSDNSASPDMTHDELQKELENGAFKSIHPQINKYNTDIQIALTIKSTAMQTAEKTFRKLRIEKKLDVIESEKMVDELFDYISKSKNYLLSLLVNNRYKHYLFEHSVNVAILSILLGIKNDLTKEQIRDLGLSALFHDVGFIHAPAELFTRKGNFSEEELDIVKAHPIVGKNLLSNFDKLNQDILDAVYEHHEKVDGSGYPRSISGDKIGLYARIIGITNTFDSAINSQLYSKPISEYYAMRKITSLAQRRFDSKLVKSFVKELSVYPIGSIVELNNGSIGRVINSNETSAFRPKIIVYYDQDNNPLSDNEYIDLLTNKEYFIKRVINHNEITKMGLQNLILD